MICMILLVLPGGSRMICMIRHVFPELGLCSYADPVQSLTMVGDWNYCTRWMIYQSCEC